MATVHGSGSLIGALTTADVTPSLPTLFAADDILICITANRVTTNTCTTPSGWTLLHGPVDTTNWRTYAFWKRAAGGDANPLCDWTATSADKYAFTVAIRGAITSGNPFAASNLAADLTDPIVVTGITTTEANQLVVVLGLGSDNVSASVTVTSTDPATYTVQDFQTIATGADATKSVHYATRATAGATGDVTLDHNSTMPAEAVLVAAFLDPVTVVLPPPPTVKQYAVTRSYYI